ncbi:hypothetical protein, partial [Prevotella sp.]|uniref:hypothetical protein n=1 Tax=Prevotella sp. TaxID=59823 RepID=UPI00257D7C7F
TAVDFNLVFPAFILRFFSTTKIHWNPQNRTLYAVQGMKVKRFFHVNKGLIVIRCKGTFIFCIFIKNDK